jgi:8-oxo-dGTP diphosphatase
MYTFKDDFGLPVTLTFDPAIYQHRIARHVLVFPFFQGQLLFTRHPQRGIELPGGKVEPGEISITAASRETYEETGFALSSITKIGQYTVGDDMIKDIFWARAEQPTILEPPIATGEYILFAKIPVKIDRDARFSRFLYDDVYPLTLSYLKSHQIF